MFSRFETTLENAYESLQKDGVCVINKNQFGNPFIENYEELREQIWENLNYIHPEFNYNDTQTYKSFFDFYPLHSMLLQHHSIGHIQPVWDIRQNPDVFNVFSTIWSEHLKQEITDFTVSFDGISVMLPPEITGKGWFKNTEWTHRDQSYLKQGFQSVQGLINLYPVYEGDATLAVVPKSHLEHENIDKFEKLDKSDWVKCPGRLQDTVRVVADAGSLVLWDSRTIHQGIEPLKSRENENFRMVVYVCMLPRFLMKPAQLKKRQQWLNDLRLTNHYGSKLFPKTPRLYPGQTLKVFNKPPPPILTELGESLI